MDSRRRCTPLWIAGLALGVAFAARASAFCGDGMLDAGEECDRGALNGASCCLQSCTLKSCDDQQLCTIDSCVDNPARHRGDCRHDSAPAGAPCTSDGNPCTHDACNSQGGCTHVVLSVPEADCDGNPCTVPTCSANGQCLETGRRCDDGDPCTNDLCDPHTGACSTTPASDGTTCGLGDGCHQVSRCFAHQCVPGAAVVCADDGNPCTVEQCVVGQGCVSRDATDGAGCPDDDNPCTDDMCSNGRCEHRLVAGRSCSLGVCQPAGICVATSPTYIPHCTLPQGSTSCVPGQPCQTDGAACDDANPCTTTSACDEGRCVGSCPSPCPTDDVACDDSNPCTPSSVCADGTCGGIGCAVGQGCPEACGLFCQDVDGACVCAPQ